MKHFDSRQKRLFVTSCQLKQFACQPIILQALTSDIIMGISDCNSDANFNKHKYILSKFKKQKLSKTNFPMHKQADVSAKACACPIHKIYSSEDINTIVPKIKQSFRMTQNFKYMWFCTLFVICSCIINFQLGSTQKLRCKSNYSVYRDVYKY